MKLPASCLSLALALLVVPRAAQSGAAANYPATPRRPAADEYHGVTVTEDYRWLENAADPIVREWTRAQNNLTRDYLDRLPVRELLQDQLEEIYEEASANYSGLVARPGLIFALKFKPPAQQPEIVTLTSLRRSGRQNEKVVFNPNKFDLSGTTAIDFYVPSRDGKLVAVCLSKNGSEDGELHFFEIGRGQQVDNVIPRVQYPTAGGSVAWTADGKGVYYTRYPHPGERPYADLNFYQQIYFHQLGTPVADDKYELGQTFPRIAEISLETSDDGARTLATVANGDGGDYAHYLRQPAGEWKQITRFEDAIKHVEFGQNGALYLLSRADAPRGKILRLAPDTVELSRATPFVNESEAVIESFAPSAHGLYVKDLVGGPSQIRYFDSEGNFKKTLPIRPVSAVQQMLVRREDELVFRNVSYTEPYGWFTWDPATNKVQRTSLNGSTSLDFSRVEVVREFAPSKDGTKIPISIIRNKGTTLDGKNPTVLYAYGGYGISLAPDFRASRRLWLDAGGVYAIANLRGGGEFGEEWHKAGNLTKKQNVFDDFAACADYLIKAGYTNPKKLAVEGGSNGGLLMGAFLTQHPDLARAVVSHVGIYDMLRVELEPNGAFNVTEYGSVKDAEQFKALYAYSPYHQVKDATAYPAVLFTTGEHDGRVNPYNSRKMTARLQAATRSDLPILLRTSASAGHGIGSSLRDRISEESDVLAFLLDQLEASLLPWISGSPVDRGPWSGALTPTSATVKAKLFKAGTAARLAVSRTADLAEPKYSAPEMASTNHGKVVAFSLAGLQPDTRYFYALEIDGKMETNKAGALRTFPVGPASFTFAYASCAKTGSTNSVFDTIRENHPLFYMNIGDFHYLNITNNNPNKFRRAYDRVLNSPPQARLYREVPFAYVWDDHDFGGDNSNRKASSHEAARLTYEEYVPHYPLASGDGDVPIYQSFTVGRAKFILTDLRSERDDAAKRDNAQKTMLGAKQKEWFKSELLAAKDKYPLIFWVSTVPWIGHAGSNYYHVSTNTYGYLHHTNLVREPPARRPVRPPRYPFGEDSWSVFATERREIADFIKEHQIQGVVILHGDSHMLAADDGTDSDYATGGGAPIPVLCAAPLDQTPSLKGGPYSQGVYRVRKNEGCFGLVAVHDEGKEITVSYSGRNNQNEEKISLKFKVPAGGER